MINGICENEDQLLDAVEHPEEETDNNEPLEVLNLPASFTLAEYTSKLDKGIFYRPEFQRNRVWTDKNKSRFIESLLFGYPITQVLLYKNPEKESYLIVDGYQRITTIYDFMKNNLKLSGITDEYNGKIFDNLSEDVREKFSNIQIQALIIRQIKKNPYTLYSIFERINTGGQNLNNMEVRRAVNYGPFMKALEELNADENWRKILGIDGINNRFLDVELLLRLVAFYYSWDSENSEMRNYKSMKGFLNKYAEDNSQGNIDEFNILFKNAAKLIVEELGEKPFTLYTRYNYVLLDSVITAVLLSGANISNLKGKFEMLKLDDEFKKIYEAKQGTISLKAVNDRIAIATRIIS